MRPLRVCLPVEVLAFSLAVLLWKTGGSLLSDFGGFSSAKCTVFTGLISRRWFLLRLSRLPLGVSTMY